MVGPGATSPMAALNAPGAMLPVSTSPSLKTTRWVTVSTLCQTTVWPGGTVAGFGENDCAPLMPMTSITTAPAGGAAEPVGADGDVLP